MRTRSRNWLYLRVCVAALLAGLVVGFVAESPATATPPPTTSVLVPANGATLSGTAAAVDATASNATSVEFWLLGGSYGFTGHLIGTATSTLYGWVYSWNTTTVPNGSYALLSEAIGAGGSGFGAGGHVVGYNGDLGRVRLECHQRRVLDLERLLRLHRPPDRHGHVHPLRMG